MQLTALLTIVLLAISGGIEVTGEATASHAKEIPGENIAESAAQLSKNERPGQKRPLPLTKPGVAQTTASAPSNSESTVKSNGDGATPSPEKATSEEPAQVVAGTTDTAAKATVDPSPTAPQREEAVTEESMYRVSGAANGTVSLAVLFRTLIRSHWDPVRAQYRPRIFPESLKPMDAGAVTATSSLMHAVGPIAPDLAEASNSALDIDSASIERALKQLLKTVERRTPSGRRGTDGKHEFIETTETTVDTDQLFAHCLAALQLLVARSEHMLGPQVEALELSKKRVAAKVIEMAGESGLGRKHDWRSAADIQARREWTESRIDLLESQKNRAGERTRFRKDNVAYKGRLRHDLRAEKNNTFSGDAHAHHYAMLQLLQDRYHALFNASEVHEQEGLVHEVQTLEDLLSYRAEAYGKGIRKAAEAIKVTIPNMCMCVRFLSSLLSFPSLSPSLPVSLSLSPLNVLHLFVCKPSATPYPFFSLLFLVPNSRREEIPFRERRSEPESTSC
jgi:hypothetical protein